MIKRIILLIFIAVLTSGCWDSRYLKDVQLIYSGSFDLEEYGQVKTTVSIPKIEVGAQQSPNSRIVSSIGNTVRQSRMRVDQEVSGRLDSSKTRVILIGEEAAKTDIYSYIDVFYRDPRSPLNAKIAITSGKAAPYLDRQVESQPLISEYLRDLLDAGEVTTILPVTNIQFICPVLFDPGQDITLPYLRIREDSEEVHANETALFNQMKMTGVIGTEESTVLLLLMNELQRTASLTIKVDDTKTPDMNNFVTVQITNLKHDLNVKESPNGLIDAHIELTAKLNVLEYPEDNLNQRETIVKLNQKIEDHLQQVANRTINEIQKANCDALGIGRELIAIHPKTWEKLDWQKDYPNINLTTTIHTEIATHGIIN
ncbi:Ger(x)C family spore germination protein [Bacillus sp. FJAT-45037]|uniref:Ger(x)C family spore germination protein n=1 Tax=Bacillus sp. FJAT-45037 TaxID=2011007 RepID=UPI000C23ABFF|nr:Ger(x)C family spore germination protein [Bacillus sp. FJAT-45037]